ncbi:MAG: extracellular solute-binding protein [Bacilli bacterium]
MFKKLMIAFLMIASVFMFVGCTKDDDVVESLDNIKIYGPFDTFDPETDYVHQLIKDITGVDVDYDFLPQDGASANTKLYLDIAGQAEYHLMKLAPTQFDQLRAVGALLDITELLNEYGTNITSSVSEEVWKTATYDGKIYGVPQKNPSNNINSALFLRKDIFVENEIALPTTLTEFKDAMVALKTKLGTGFVPFSASSHNIEPIRGAFGIVTDWVPQTDGTLKYWTETAAF